jgi:hypothetical protein
MKHIDHMRTFCTLVDNSSSKGVSPCKKEKKTSIYRKPAFILGLANVEAYLSPFFYLDLLSSFF